MKIFVSYTSSDRDWAHWIGWQLKNAGHEPFVHEWEIGAGQNIPRWMEDRLKEADCLVGVFSDAYCDALYSQSERWAAYWQDPGGRSGFLVPIEVSKVAEWPPFVKPLKRLSLLGRNETEAAMELIVFLKPPRPPATKPRFPGGPVAVSSALKFVEGGDPISTGSPAFPVSAPGEVGQSPLPTSSPSTDIRCIDDHEPKPQIYGRESEIETVVQSILEGQTIIIAGGPGMGKTSLATAAIYDSRVVERFGRRRIFASLEAATEPRSILARIVEMLGVPAAGDEGSLHRIIETRATEGAFVAILDNAETVFDADPEKSERLLNLIARMEGLSLIVTIRGIAPPIAASAQIGNLSKLDPASGRTAFLATSGKQFESDPDLDHLLDALDGHALSIRLIAARAIGLPALKGLREMWDEARAEILRTSAKAETRLTSVRASLSLSLNSQRMKGTPLARRLVSVLAFLPGGLAEVDALQLIGERGTVTRARINEAISCLHQLRLIEQRFDRRLRMLTPLRESARADVRPLEVDKKRLIDFYLDIAQAAFSIGSRKWESHRGQVESEADNLDAICELAIFTDIGNSKLEKALLGLKEFYLRTGGAAISAVIKGAEFLRETPSTLAASCFRCLGQISMKRNDDQAARLQFQSARQISRIIKDTLGEAHSVHMRGALEAGLSNHKVACSYIKEAASLYRKTRDAVGEANCLMSLGDIDRKAALRGKAIERVNDALAIFRRVGNILGVTQGIDHLGHIELDSSNYAEARKHFEEALALEREIGDDGGRATTLRGLGEISFEMGNFGEAIRCFDEALALNRRTGEVLGEAEARIRLGRLKGMVTGGSDGLVEIEAGFSLYFEAANANDLAFSGWKAMRTALTSRDQEEEKNCRKLAASSWTEIGRHDLVLHWAERA